MQRKVSGWVLNSDRVGGGGSQTGRQRIPDRWIKETERAPRHRKISNYVWEFSKASPLRIGEYVKVGKCRAKLKRKRTVQYCRCHNITMYGIQQETPFVVPLRCCAPAPRARKCLSGIARATKELLLLLETCSDWAHSSAMARRTDSPTTCSGESVGPFSGARRLKVMTSSVWRNSWRKVMTSSVWRNIQREDRSIPPYKDFN